jgi:cytochrome P450
MRTAKTVFRPLDPAVREDPYPTYRWLRDAHPIAWATTPASGFIGFWFVSRYDDVFAGLRDNRFGREIAKVFPPEAFPPIPEADRPLYTMIGNWMLFKDPPDHDRLRKIAAPVFSARSVLAMRPRLEALIAAALARLPDSGPVDIISDFSSPLSIDIVSDLLGVPEEDHKLIRGWVREVTMALDLVRTPETIRTGSARAANLLAYFRELIRRHRAGGSENVLTQLLIAADDAGSFLDETELLAACVLFLFAGHEASSLLIGNGLLALSAHPEQYARLQRGEVPGKSAVSELLRYDSPQQIAFRHALEDFEFRGVPMRKGQTIGFCMGSANRDPAHFDDPDRLDLARVTNKHLAFGTGIHTCAGATLANLEAELVFTEVARRYPRLEVVRTERQESILVRGLTRLYLAG